MTSGDPEASATGPAMSADPATVPGIGGSPQIARREPAPAAFPVAAGPAADSPGMRTARPALAAPVIRPSVVHIPASLLPLIAAERLRSGRSNGQILIDAIEAGHEHLVKLHNESNSIGGRLFTARTAKPRLPVAQPLSPLNIRLYEQDYEVLDRLVSELGAGSRSRLATLALARYLDGSA
ncbi:hypothetical protein [Jiangella gansuensis]|uniref:hypothetical protein n=1 Tax=Jiangella gansuensis TaxID=281473 RepID=UPI00068807D8|nr:hypothetical protein [Jiangella gansuensis]